MGIYLGQLPPAEIARFKAELAETLIANFCYPRFFDHRTGNLQTRPVDRTKRQDVWLYLSSFDFTAWSRIDLMSDDLQLQVERLFIQFVQRNRSFFGNQGRRRMTDIRTLIGSCAGSVSQGLRNHLSGQRPSASPFGSPRPVISWGATPISGKTVATWEQISASTMLLQQQLQEVRGEIRAGATDTRQPQSPNPSASSARRTPTRPQPVASPSSAINGGTGANFGTVPASPSVIPTPTPTGASRIAAHVTDGRNPAVVSPAPDGVAASGRRAPTLTPPVETNPARKSQPLAISAEVPPFARKSGALISPTEPVPSARKPEQVSTAVASFAAATSPAVPATPVKVPAGRNNGSENGSAAISPSQSLRAIPTSGSARGVASAPTREAMSIGEDDLAIFEQMRHQLLLWLKLEAVTAGLDISNQGPAQLLELLRQQARFDETRLQVVSTLLNLANQVLKTGTVSVLDYKQALMFHLMHTRRS